MIARRQADLAGVTTGTCDVAIAPATYGVEPGSVDDRSCDRCGVYVPPRLPLCVRVVETRRGDGLRILVPFGLCRSCMDAEMVA